MITPKTGETIPERAEPAPGGRLELIEKIRSREARIGVIGLGYVGLPLVSEFSRAGFDVTGFDIDAEKVNLLKQGKSYIRHIDGKKIRNLKSFIPTTDFSHISEMDCIIACAAGPFACAGICPMPCIPP